MSNLDELKAQYEEAEVVEAAAEKAEPEPEVETETETETEAEVEVEVEVKAEDNPPGFIGNYEDWVAQGKNPDLYKGKLAYKAEYDRIQEVKGLKANVREMNETLEATVNAIQARDNKAEARHRVEIESAIAQAKEDNDIEAYDTATKRMSELEDVAALAPKKSRMHPVLSEFIGNNPSLEDTDVNAEFQRIYHGKLRADGVGINDQLSDTAIQGYTRTAMDRVKELLPNKFASPKKTRLATPKIKPKSSPTNSIDQDLDGGYKVSTDKNSNATRDIYNMIKKDVGPEAAEKFLKKFKNELENR